jgi:hypothetical protein
MYAETMKIKVNPMLVLRDARLLGGVANNPISVKGYESYNTG